MKERERKWAKAYLEQAKADLKSAKILGMKEPSVFCMLMQMTLEKTSKAFLLIVDKQTVEQVNKSHAGVSKVIRIYSRHNKFNGNIHKTDSFKILSKWKFLFKLIECLEKANPAFADGGPNLEYPWEESDGKVCWPARDLKQVKDISDIFETKTNKLINFAGEWNSFLSKKLR